MTHYFVMFQFVARIAALLGPVVVAAVVLSLVIERHFYDEDEPLSYDKYDPKDHQY